MDYVESLIHFCELNEINFNHGRQDYSNLFDNLPVNQIQLFLFSGSTVVNVSDHAIQNQVITCEILLALHSDIGDDYSLKYKKHIKPLRVAALRIAKHYKTCEPYRLTSFSFDEVINRNDANLDGVLINLSLLNKEL